MIKATIKLPVLPKFVTVVVGSGDVSISVADLTDEDIDELGKRWTEALKRHAKGKRVPAVATRIGGDR